MVATGRAVKQHSRAKVAGGGRDPLSRSLLDMTLPYSNAGRIEAEQVIISFNDDEDTSASDIEAVLALADIELACIRGEVAS
jgi:hypothetical protein